MSNDTGIDLRALRVFSVVAHSGSLTQAADKLGITQSAVSQTLKQLEEQTGVEMVIRSSRPITLTAGGRILKSYAEKIESDMERMLNEIQLSANNKLAHLRLGMIDSFGDAAGQQLLSRIEPLVTSFSLRSGFTGPLSTALAEREIDLLITTDPLDDHHEFEHHNILHDPFVMVVSNSFAERSAITVAKLANELPFAGYSRDSRLGSLTSRIIRQMGITPNRVYEFDSTQSLLRTVKEGKAWALSTGLCLLRYPDLVKDLYVLKPEVDTAPRQLSLVCRAGELGELPSKLAGYCREINENELKARLQQLAHWLV
ncbi:MAG: LysR substrate-binding domain-containing protein [Pseudomonadales bacterium]